MKYLTSHKLNWHRQCRWRLVLKFHLENYVAYTSKSGVHRTSRATLTTMDPTFAGVGDVVVEILQKMAPSSVACSASLACV